MRLEAVKSLDPMKQTKTVDALVKLVNDPDPEISIRATDGLVNVICPGISKPASAAPYSTSELPLKAKFSDSNDQVIDAYVEVRPEVITALGTLVKQGAGTTASGRHAGAIGAAGRAAIPDLVETTSF